MDPDLEYNIKDEEYENDHRERSYKKEGNNISINDADQRHPSYNYRNMNLSQGTNYSLVASSTWQDYSEQFHGQQNRNLGPQRYICSLLKSYREHNRHTHSVNKNYIHEDNNYTRHEAMYPLNESTYQQHINRNRYGSNEEYLNERGKQLKRGYEENIVYGDEDREEVIM